MLESPTRYLFVYGTFLPGGRRHRHLRRLGAARVGAAWMRARLYRIPGADYPGAVPAEGGREKVWGDLYRLERPGAALRLLDRIEGVEEGLFRRQVVIVHAAGGVREKAWTYFYARPLEGAERIVNGRYRPPGMPARG
jgi:gamma-glutamylcyclotransferase (GGCT)/AIG2-like uncharacterized protein YtfP